MSEDITKAIKEMMNSAIYMSKKCNLDTIEEIEQYVKDEIKAKGFNSLEEFIDHHNRKSSEKS